MPLLNILQYPDKQLHTIAQPVSQFDARIKQLVKDMAETMYDAPGIGLAATQVNVHERVIVIDVSENKNELRVFINPTITQQTGETSYEEGCLSIPGVYDTVYRAESISVDAFDEDGKPFTIDASGLLAICIQHEIDHLNGKLFIQYLSPLKQSRIKAKMKKRARQAQED